MGKVMPEVFSEPENLLTQPEHSDFYVLSDSSFWFYLLGLLLILSSSSVAISMSFSEVFNLNIAIIEDLPYSSCRVWGGIGGLLGSTALCVIGEINYKTFLIFLLFMYIASAMFNILLITLCSDKQTFNMHDSREVPNLEPVFKFSKNCLLGRKTLFGYKNEVKLSTQGTYPSVPITAIKFDTEPQFDTMQDDVFRNIRRCSLAPLGDSFVIKQFELDDKSAKHFNYVTKIEQIELSTNQIIPRIEYVVDNATIGTISTKFALDYLNAGKRDEATIWLHLKIIKLMLRNGKLTLGLLIPLIINGFISSMQVYFNLFLYTTDQNNFFLLSSLSLVYNQIGETITLYILAQFKQLISYSTGLNTILYVYGIRYSMYSIFIFYNKLIPLDYIIAVELLQALSGGLFSCVVNESAVDFAFKSSEDSLKDGRFEQIFGLQNDGKQFKLILVAILNFFVSIGKTAGFFASILLVKGFEFKIFWMFSAILAFSMGSCQTVIFRLLKE